jgi:hypothetical protein
LHLPQRDNAKEEGEMILTQLFVDIDDFCKAFEAEHNKRLLSEGKMKRRRQGSLSLSEVMTIAVFFHLSKYRTFKDYYLQYVQKQLKSAFPGLVSYQRFVELMPRAMVPLIAFMQQRRLGKVSGISFIDATTIEVCHIKREKQHKVFKGLATKGKTSMGWFYGFKLHMVINERGEILSFFLTPGHVNDKDETVIDHLTKGLFGKLIGDKGYISQKLFEKLLKRGIRLITKLKKRMKNKLMPLIDKLLLRKRALIESLFDQLKNIAMLEHTRHRSPINAMVNWMGALIAYSYQPSKPSIRGLDEKDRLSAQSGEIL